MREQTNGQKLQQAYRRHVLPYSDYIQLAVTLTLKQVDNIRVKRFTNYGSDYYEFRSYLDEEKLAGLIRYFTALLTHELYGNKAKHKNKKQFALPLVITVVEGRNTRKHTHLHLAIGNIQQEKLGDIEALIKRIWNGCDFSNKQVCVKHVNNNVGWLSYITKEVGYTDNDALDICASTIPPFIQQRICTESRLRTA